ncbi:MAG: 50S ribosomal protein L32 [Bacteroidota bacterium]|nr:50S ribosomal protein L32 [Bacteroidota bacterium]MXW83179.1 50S ribosomal protein L32 [Rhodothermaceae bacterium]MDE2672995.1 50S ribosomal protein L32 [Bacteroidota bacterium]MDE2771021.1 50S ribosomal protein L32 [Bacteroidota bacterium]MDE2828003.1 50S ribosomal protein L32 [Bacteroidota bacterium]
MANPRRKNSKARKRKRRAVYYGSIDKPTMVECECGRTVKLRHRICSCGVYRGRQIIEPAEDV